MTIVWNIFQTKQRSTCNFSEHIHLAELERTGAVVEIGQLEFIACDHAPSAVHSGYRPQSSHSGIPTGPAAPPKDTHVHRDPFHSVV